MKKSVFKFVILISLIVSASCFVQSFAFSSHARQTRYFESIKKSASTVVLDINNKSLRPLVSMANGKIASSQPLIDMANSKSDPAQKVVGGINGTYFSAYDGYPLPYGTIIDNGKVLHIGNYGCVIGFTQDNRVIIDNLNIRIDGYINGVNRYYAWGINHPRSEADAIVIFTPEFAEGISYEGGAVVLVENSRVKSKLECGSGLNLSENQFAIVFNEKVSSLAQRFSEGDEVGYKCNFTSNNTDQGGPESVKWDDVKYAIGAGPSLIIDSRITADGLSEGFYEAKINNQRAQRSFIGVTGDNKIIMGTMSGVTIKELARACQEMGLKSAMCLDGGASSGLCYEGGYLTRPGRNINNALIFVEDMSLQKQVRKAE